jgi:hypothetical protein
MSRRLAPFWALIAAALVLCAVWPAHAEKVQIDPNYNKVQVVDGSGNPVTAGGDASAANQTAVQANAGSDASKAVSVQGITGGKAVSTSAAQSGTWTVGLTGATSSSFANAESYLSRLTSSAGPMTPGSALATTSFMAGCVYNSTLPTFANANQGALQCDSNGRLRVQIGGSANSGSDGAVNNLGYFTYGNSSMAPMAVGGYTFNGTTLDQLRGVTNGLNSTGTGIAAAGVVAQCDDTSPTAVTENQFGNVRRNCATGELRTTGAADALTDGSISLTTGGTSQQVFAANANRRFLVCQNIDAAEDAWINYGASAAASTAGSFLLKANGGSYTFDGNFVPSGTVNVVAATTGHKFTCKQA